MRTLEIRAGEKGTLEASTLQHLQVKGGGQQEHTAAALRKMIRETLTPP